MSRAPAKSRVLIGISGGVHSAVTAALLKSQGLDMIGLHLIMGPLASAFQTRCRAESDPKRAREICQKLEIPYFEWDARELFEAQVTDDFVHQFLQLRLPHPCLRCTREVVMKLLFERAGAMGVAEVATGHHAQVIPDPFRKAYRLTQGVGTRPDQSYLLYQLTPAELARMKVPLGGIPATMVARMASEFGFGAAAASNDGSPCFIEHPDRPVFVEERSAAGLRPRGVVRTRGGESLGEHAGLHSHPIGSKTGPGLSFTDSEYITVGFDPSQQALILGKPEDLADVEVLGIRSHWVSDVHGLREVKCKARVNSQGGEASCHVTIFENDTVRVEFDEPWGPLVPGQSIVFYEEDEVLGGAVIERVGKQDKNEPGGGTDA